MQTVTLDVRARLRGALEAKGWSVLDLHRRSGIDCSRVSLHRKLYGYRRRYKGRARYQFQPLTVEEVQTLARPLKLEVDVS